METACYRIKLKPGSLPKVEEWASRLNSEKSEVAKLLVNEGVSIESVFLEDTSEGQFLIYYLRAKSLKAAQEAVALSQHPIDVYHRETLTEITEDFSVLRSLVQFE